MAYPLPERVEVADDVLWQEVEGQAVFVELNAGRYFTLDPVGTRIWKELVDGPDTGAALARLLDVYDVDEATLRTDVVTLIERLETSRLLRPRA